jgi:transposase-like protein
MKKLNDKEKIEVVEKYLAGASSCQLSKEYGITDTSILGLLKRRGIVRRTKSDYK